MKKETNIKKIGLIITFGFFILLSIIFFSIFNKIKYKNNIDAVLYFNESLKGLSIGSPVMFKGIEIGKVASIKLDTDINNPLNFKIPVYISLNNLKETKKKFRFWKKTNIFSMFIKNGLKARLITQNFITGQLAIELFVKKIEGEEIKINIENDIIEIPTLVSKVTEMSENINNINIKELSSNLQNLLLKLNELIPVITDISKKISLNIDDTIQNMNKTFSDISDTANSIKNLTDYLEEHPESIVRGKKK